MCRHCYSDRLHDRDGSMCFIVICAALLAVFVAEGFAVFLIVFVDVTVVEVWICIFIVEVFDFVFVVFVTFVLYVVLFIFVDFMPMFLSSHVSSISYLLT